MLDFATRAALLGDRPLLLHCLLLTCFFDLVFFTGFRAHLFLLTVTCFLLGRLAFLTDRLPDLFVVFFATLLLLLVVLFFDRRRVALPLAVRLALFGLPALLLLFEAPLLPAPIFSWNLPFLCETRPAWVALLNANFTLAVFAELTL